MFDAGEIHERLDAVKSENLKRLDDDIDILKAYLKTQKVPKTVATAFKGLTIEQHVSWKKAVEKIEELLEQPDCAGFRSGGLVAGDQTEITKVCK
jgi:hypothetical protein